MRIAWEAAGGSDVGRVRSGNEDTFRMDAARGIFLVADGMGGHAAGEIASDLAASTVAERLAHACEEGVPREALHNALRDAFLAAHERIQRCCREDTRTRGMGTTLTACVLNAEGDAQIGHIGDSRLYRMREGRLQQLTHDHTWVQREVDAGRVAPEAAHRHPFSHILTRVLSDDLAPEVDVFGAELAPGDLILLATDGLYNMLSDAAIAALLSQDLPLPRLAEALIDAANQAGGADNITALLVRAKKVED